VRPLRGLHANGSQIVDTNFNEVQIFAGETAADGPVLGKAFLSQVGYLVGISRWWISIS